MGATDSFGVIPKGICLSLTRPSLLIEATSLEIVSKGHGFSRAIHAIVEERL
jgi:hypothetical protein